MEGYVSDCDLPSPISASSGDFISNKYRELSAVLGKADCTRTITLAGRQTVLQADRQKDLQTDRQTDGKIDRQAER